MIAIEWKVHVKLKLSETQEVKNCDNYYVLIDLTLFYNSSYKLWLISELLFIKKRRFYLLNYSNCCANKTKNLKGNFYFFRRIVSNIKLLLVIFLLLPITPPPPSISVASFRISFVIKCTLSAKLKQPVIFHLKLCSETLYCDSRVSLTLDRANPTWRHVGCALSNVTSRWIRSIQGDA